MTAQGRRYRTTDPTPPPTFPDIDADADGAQNAQTSAGKDAQATASESSEQPTLVKVRATHGPGSQEAELLGDRQKGRPNVRKVIYTSSRTAAWVAVERIQDAPAGKRTRRPAAPKRRKEALDLVTANPGITIPELATQIGIKQNYLYRLMPDMEKAGEVTKQGRGWHPASQDNDR